MCKLGGPHIIGGFGVQVLLAFSRIIDAISTAVGRVAEYLVLICCLVSAGVASVRYLFSYSSNGWLEIQWYMFAAIVLLGASHTLRMNEHVRVDLVIPPCLFLMWLCWPFFYLSFQQGEMSQNASGLIRWPVKLVMVAGFALLAAQGLSELIKRVASLMGYIVIDTKYEKPLQ